MKRRRFWLGLLALLILLTLGFIWGNSMKSIPESQAVSLSLLSRIKPLLDAVFGPDRITDHIIRKTAHFCEFALLGAELRLLFLLLGQRVLQGSANSLFAGLAVAVADETIQIFSHRGSQVRDVFIDAAGVLLGLGAVLLLARLRRRAAGKKS